MLVLEINGERVAFFNEPDVSVEVAEGEMVQYTIIRKGQYMNGFNLALTGSRPNFSGSALEPPVNEIITPIPLQKSNHSTDEHPPMHALSATQLEELYNQVQATCLKPTFLGQVSNQERSARIEELLQAILHLLQERAG